MYNYAAELNWPTESDMYMNGSILAESHVRRFTLPASAMPAMPQPVFVALGDMDRYELCTGIARRLFGVW